MANMKVSVIICAYTMERLNDIHEAVASVMAQTLKPHEVIIAVDHNQELFQRLKTELPPEVKIVLNEGVQGLSETRNVGIRTATGDIVAFIDDDAVAEKDWLRNLTKHFENSEVLAVGGRAVPDWSEGKRPLWFPEELDWIVGCTYKGLPTNKNEIRNVPGCNMAFRKNVCQEAGLFKSEFGRIGKMRGVAEESELCIRIKQMRKKGTIIYEYDSVIHHKVPSWRLNLKYLTQRSYDEGFYKNMINRVFAESDKKSLSTEDSYLRYLLFTSIPGRLRYFYRQNSLLQMGAIIIGIAATGAGYLVGRLKV
ncbi:MAG: glycosyltransferase family 2 protein [Dehalococcoidales bacterium]|nr:glycosyltransferase family 2 protein [Dehalococcoidales bacterium]